MTRLYRWLPAALALILSGAAAAQEPIRFARTPDISPDGKLVAFSYRGDVWTVETIGGVARPVTMHTAHDVYPVFSPDGRSLAFSSNRHGSYDVYVVPVQGGKPTRLTFDSAQDIVNGWSADGKQILFASTRGVDFPQAYQLYTVPVEGGRVQRLTAFEGKEGSFSPRGDLLAYVQGPGTWYRKGYRGSSNDDIWVCDVNGQNSRRLTTFNGQDNAPMWSPDGQTLYYASEVLGSPANIVRQDAAGRSAPQPLTHHLDDAVRRARISGNGEWIVYECGCDLWVASTRDGQTRKLAVEVNADDKTNREENKTFTSEATDFAVSPDERHVVFTVHGELFLMQVGASAAPKRLTDHPAFDHAPVWSTDGQKVIFASDRGGFEDLYLLEANDPEQKDFTRANKFKVTQLTNTPAAETGVMFAPDGSQVTFLRSGNLWTMKPDGKDPKVLVSEPQVFDYDWSPDSKWLVYSRLDGHFASELFIVPAAGGQPRNVTRYATFNAGVTWSANGKKLGFISERRGSPGMHVLSLQKPATPDAPYSNDIDWEDVHTRVERASPLPSIEGAISPDGSKVAFRAQMGGDDLWVASSNGQQMTRLTTGNHRPEQIQWSRRSSETVFYRDGSGLIHKARVGGDNQTLNFKVKLTIRQDEQYAEMFEQCWRALLDNFYDAKFHGADWNAVREKYRPVVKHVVMKEDLYTLVSLMLGELNASHLGISGPGATPDETTAHLGLLYDESYRGPGLKVTEILKHGPADRRGMNLKPGDLILSIDGYELTEKTPVCKALNDKVNQTVTLAVTSNPADPKATRKVEMQAVGRDQVGSLMYERWVERNARRVEELSKGKLGYIHIPSMDEAGLDRFVRSLYSDNFDKEAIVLDVRYNGGGFTHDQILNYLGAREHTFFRQRNGGEGTVLRAYDRKWFKPLVTLINNRSYSDAEIFPSAFRTLGLGKLVGQPTGGFVIGTTAQRLIDGSSFRLPRTGVFTVKGINMEKEGVAPDVLVEPHPDQLAKGVDAQLDKAVEVLLADVANWKRAQTPVAAGPAEGKGTGPAGVVAPMPMAK